MKNILLLIALAFSFSSCATTSQLAELRFNVEEHMAGNISQEVFEERNAAWEADVEESKKTQEEAAIGLVEILTGGTGLAGALYGVYKQSKKAAVAQVHHERDKKYVEANVNVAPAPA